MDQYIVTGVDYGNLMLRLRLNGEVKQEEKTDHLIHDVPSAVSFISQYVTLHPGDLIFTGTPGRTSDIKAGDVVEVELEEVGVLRNPVVAGSSSIGLAIEEVGRIANIANPSRT